MPDPYKKYFILLNFCIPRYLNSQADLLSNLTNSSKPGNYCLVIQKTLKSSRVTINKVKGEHVLGATKTRGDTWITPYVQYLAYKIIQRKPKSYERMLGA